jgi:predicted O-linked N-acetylglucosamine transferase (SPINDLY family)
MGLREVLEQAVNLHRQGRLADAEGLYTAALRSHPGQFDALHLLGVLRHHQGRNAEALELIAAALKASPNSAAALANYGLVLQELGRFEAALEAHRKAFALTPDRPEILVNIGNALRALGRAADALAHYDRALAIDANDSEALFNRGFALLQLGRHGEAIASYDRLLAINPNDAEAHNNRGNVLNDIARLEEALASYDRALAIRRDYPEALNNRGAVLTRLKRPQAALASFDQALALRPAYAAAHNNRGNALAELERIDEALASYDRAIAAWPDYAEALCNRGGALADLRRHAEAIESFERGLALAPGHPRALSGLANSAVAICDWVRTARLTALLEEHVRARKSIISPQVFLGYCDDPALQLACARNYAQAQVAHVPPQLAAGAIQRRPRIRLGYVCADFRRHATTHLVAGLFEQHDRSRFEVYGISIGPGDDSDIRTRVVRSFDQFLDLQAKSDHEVARLMHELKIDISVDMMGRRPAIFAPRPAPIAVNYLVYPGTMGADFYDYILADAIVLPFDQQPFYAERIVHLPDSYQVNDARRAIAPQVPSREEAGLPARGFVFCCFNNPYKITAEMFAVWMRLMGALDGSVLWLLRDDPATEANLRREAAARGVDPARLVFAGRLEPPQHLARHRLADLFLDTLPYNAHTTASDALWAGLPVLTCRGRAFPGRVAASLLHAVGLDELVTYSLADYEALALRLAGDPALLGGLRQKLEGNRSSAPLFDTARTCRHMEAAYQRMWELALAGEPPRSFAVEA